MRKLSSLTFHAVIVKDIPFVEDLFVEFISRGNKLIRSKFDLKFKGVKDLDVLYYNKITYKIYEKSEDCE